MKYYIWVLGCAMNNSDAERIATVLELLGYKKTENESEANLIVVVACSVRQSAINRIYGSAVKWRRLKAQRPELRAILTGCVLEKDKPMMQKIFDLIFKIDDISKFVEFIKLDNSLEISNSKLGFSGEYLSLEPKYESEFRAYVPIMTGCNNFCSYCAVPYTRGREVSRPEKEILAEIKELVKKGYKEITLLGQNVNSYGLTQKSNLPGRSPARAGKNQNDSIKFITLLKNIDTIEGDYRVYFYSNHPKDMSEELIKALPTLKHFPAYIHLPLQSGSDRILKKMNRHYTKKQYLDLALKIRKAMQNLTLTTDVIVGYPGESKKDFKETKEVMEKAKFDMAFIAQYSPRPGTKSTKEKDDVSKEKKKEREQELNKILAATALENNRKLVGTTQKVLLDGKKSGTFYGRTEGYKVVEVQLPPKGLHPLKGATLKKGLPDIGQFVEVKIQKADSWKLIGSF